MKIQMPKESLRNLQTLITSDYQSLFDICDKLPNIDYKKVNRALQILVKRGLVRYAFKNNLKQYYK